MIFGPGSEPVDRVRRITNASTGELGSLLCERFAVAGYRVRAFRGRASTFPPPRGIGPVGFDSGTDLLAALDAMPGPERERVGAVFHLAALPDFRVEGVFGPDGEPLEAGKIPSGTGKLHLVLVPAPKVIDRLRALFPSARLVGWKYEIDGGREDALGRARRLVSRAGLDLCVANGPAYGEGFGLVPAREGGGAPADLRDKAALADALLGWLEA